MSDVLQKLKVIIEGTAAPYKKVVDETRKMTSDMVNSVKTETDRMGSSSFGSKIAATMKDAQRAVKLFAADARVAAGVSVYTDDFVLLTTDIHAAEDAAENLQTHLRNLEVTGHVDTEEYEALENTLQEVENEARNLRGRLRQMVDSGNVTRFSGMINVVKRLGSAFASLGRNIGQVAGTMITKAGGAMKSLIHRFANGVSAIRRFINTARGSQNSMRNLGKTILQAGLGVYSLTALFSKLKSAISEGFSMLAETNAPVVASINQLKASLAQLKLSLATAFAPIVEAVAPLLNFLISKITAVINAFGQMMAAFTGRGSFTRATAAAGRYAAGLDKTASSAGKATEENKALQRTLMGFDEINKLNDDTGSSGSESSGSGAGTGGLFEEIPIGQNIKNFTDKIKEAWRTADFTEIGGIVGRKLRDALNRIPWGQIRNTCRKVARSAATLLNGFFETPGLFDAIGGTIAKALNTAFDTLNTFATNFHWDSFGRSISDSINGFIRTFNWKGAATSVSNIAKGILDAIINALENTNWFELGEKVKEFIVNIDWNGIADRLFEAIGAAIGGLAAFLWGLIGEAWASVVEWWKETAFEDGQFTMQGLLDGIVEKLKGIWDWIKEHIFQPFIDGFKKAFRISSPSKVMEEQGGYIIAGLLDGLKSAAVKLITWFAELPGKILNALGNAKEWLVQKGRDAVDGLKNGWEEVKESKIFSKLRSFKEDAFTAIGNVAEKVKSKGSSIIEGIKEGYENNKGSLKSVVSGLPSLISNGIGNLWQIGRNAITEFHNGFVSLHIPMPHFDFGSRTFSAGNFRITLPTFNGLSWYAKGGFPDTGEMFVARENGPELVGKMGNRPTVANNEQIVKGIASAVGPAVYSAVSNALQENNNDSGNDVYVVAPDGRQLFTVMREEGVKYQQSTGQPVFE